jgi:hypothetical protein
MTNLKQLKRNIKIKYFWEMLLQRDYIHIEIFARKFHDYQKYNLPKLHRYCY